MQTSADLPSRKTTILLDGWHGGARSALDVLLDRHLPFLRAHVRRHAQPALLAKFEVDDFVQDTARQILTYAPRFQVRDGEHFRRLLGRMVLTSISAKWKYLTAVRRDMSREARVSRDSVLRLDHACEQVARPSEVAAQAEDKEWVRLGLELLRDEDREAILRREWEDESFPEMAAALGINANAARMRYNRAMERLAEALKELRSGRIPEGLDE